MQTYYKGDYFQIAVDAPLNGNSYALEFSDGQNAYHFTGSEVNQKIVFQETSEALQCVNPGTYFYFIRETDSKGRTKTVSSEQIIIYPSVQTGRPEDYLTPAEKIVKKFEAYFDSEKSASNLLTLQLSIGDQSVSFANVFQKYREALALAQQQRATLEGKPLVVRTQFKRRY